MDQRKTWGVSFCLLTMGSGLGGCGNSSAPIVTTDPGYGTYLALGKSQNSSDSPVSSNFSLRLVGEMSPPVRNGRTLQANDIYFDGKKAYVGYNVAGATQMGAVQVVDISNSRAPELLSETFLDDTDVNAVFVKSRNLYLVGATSDEAHGPAVLQRIALSRGLPDISDSSRVALSSYAGTGVYVSGQSVYTTSGDTGGLSVRSRSSLAETSATSVMDARAVRPSRDGSRIYVMGARPGNLQVFSSAGMLQQSFSIGGAMTPESKSTLEIGKSMALISLGEAGAKLVCLEDGQALSTLDPVTVSGLSPSLTVTNAVASSTGLIFTANGEAGVYVYSFKKGSGHGRSAKCKDLQLELLGAIQFGTAISANTVYYKRGFLFVAAGLGGLKVIAIDKTKGSDDDDDFEHEDDEDEEDGEDD